MERKLKTALLTTINGYNAVVKDLHDAGMSPTRCLQLCAAKEAFEQVLQNFMKAEYVECVNGQWRIKIIVTEAASTGGRTEPFV